MKISKAKLRQIIKEIKEELKPSHSKGRQQRAHELTADGPLDALLSTAASYADPYADRALRKVVFGIVKDLEEVEFQEFGEALKMAEDPYGEGY